MPRTKSLNIVIQFVNTPLIINDLGKGHEPRYELYDIETKTVIKKSNNPLIFDAYAQKIWSKQKH